MLLVNSGSGHTENKPSPISPLSLGNHHIDQNPERPDPPSIDDSIVWFDFQKFTTTRLAYNIIQNGLVGLIFADCLNNRLIGRHGHKYVH